MARKIFLIQNRNLQEIKLILEKVKLKHKKPKKQELTAEQKEENQEFSSLRVFVARNAPIGENI